MEAGACHLLSHRCCACVVTLNFENSTAGKAPAELPAAEVEKAVPDTSTKEGFVARKRRRKAKAAKGSSPGEAISR